MDQISTITGHFETHSVAGIRECFADGVDPNQMYKGKPLIYEMINMYLRSTRFKDCIRAFVDFGLQFEDEALLAVLLDDDKLLENILSQQKDLILKRYSLDCAFTSLKDVLLLHICAEYNHLRCAEVLPHYGADINARAGEDKKGFGAHTPIFHTVNQHNNACLNMLKLLVSKGADLSLTIRGLIWGEGYTWETFVPSVNPISYAMMGLLRQFQRKEQEIYEVVRFLMKAQYGIDYYPSNIPNRYLLS